MERRQKSGRISTCTSAATSRRTRSRRTWTRTANVSMCRLRALRRYPASLRERHRHLHLRETSSRHHLLEIENRRRIRRTTTRRMTSKESMLKAAVLEISHQAFVNHIYELNRPFSGNSTRHQNLDSPTPGSKSHKTSGTRNWQRELIRVTFMEMTT